MFEHQVVLRPSARRQCLDPTGCEHGHSRKELRQIVGCIAVKAEPRAARKPGNFFEGACREWVITFLKDEDGDALQAKLTGLCGKIVHLLLHRVADEDKRVDLATCMLLQRMRKHLADLCVTAAAEIGRASCRDGAVISRVEECSK